MQGLGDKFEVGSGGLFPENLDRGILNSRFTYT